MHVFKEQYEKLFKGLYMVQLKIGFQAHMISTRKTQKGSYLYFL